MNLCNPIGFYSHAFDKSANAFQLRDEIAHDANFLFDMFIETQREASARLGADILAILGEPLLRSQFELRESGYRAAHPHAMRIVMVRRDDDAPVGRFIIDWDMDGASYGVDLAVRPMARRGAPGLQALRAWVATADHFGLDAGLHVMPDNPAARLYQKLGFVPTDDAMVPVPMRRRPLQRDRSSF